MPDSVMLKDFRTGALGLMALDQVDEVAIDAVQVACTVRLVRGTCQSTSQSWPSPQSRRSSTGICVSKTVMACRVRSSASLAA